ncbi:MAG: alpha/beta hydrolase [Bacteroidota bacterium]
MKIFKLILIVGVALLICLPGYSQLLTTGLSSFTFTQYHPFRNKPIKVYTYVPAGGNQQTMPVLMVFHGEERDANNNVTDWVAAANQYKFIVLAPEFLDSYFPGGDGYNLANMFVDGDNPSFSTLNPDSVWTFSVLDPLFLYVKQRTQSTTTSYRCFGHSAGSQFITKYLLYKPNSLMDKAVCANAGWYTMPDLSLNFPYGTKISPATIPSLKAAFAHPMLVMLGTADNDPNSAGLRHNSIVDLQGLNRLARGRYFINNSRVIANNMSTWYNWNSVEVPGVGHDHYQMALRAVPYIVDSFTGVTMPKTHSIKAWLGEGSIHVAGLDAGEGYKISVTGITGQEYFTASGKYSENEIIPFTYESSVMYILELKAENSGTIYKKLIAIP